MKIYLLSPEAVPMNQMLFPTMRKTFEEKGYSFVPNIFECDVVFIDFHSRISDYRQSDIDWIIENDVQLVTFDEWDWN